MKDKMSYIGILGVFFGFCMNKILTSMYGNNGSSILASIALTIIVVCMIIIICMKKYVVALLLLFMVLPSIVTFIGLIMDNIYVMIIGFISLFIGIPIMIKIIPKLKDKYHF
ncbi:MAG: hypothetical protein RR636_06670 [Clostridium sp.]|uniref:hypothetical protein n=1 Tax=Clostridium sp. TaxID=1506 RepID=UPI00301FE776